MSRIRSPNYPAISLAEAIERVGVLFSKEHQHAMSRDVALKGLGYSGANGASLGALSAVRKYGLVSKSAQDYKITNRAMSILHPNSPQEEAEAIEAAAYEPSLFSELLGHFQGAPPSDDNLRSYLVRKGFSQSALGGVIQSFRDTIDLVNSKTKGYSATRGMADTPTGVAAMRSAPMQPESSPNAGDPYQLTISPSGGIVIQGRLMNAEQVDDLTRSLNALKLLFKPLSEVKKPAGGG